jgi:lipoprotein-anchoring transpeptidase ErfK/SrfK
LMLGSTSAPQDAIAASATVGALRQYASVSVAIRFKLSGASEAVSALEIRAVTTRRTAAQVSRPKPALMVRLTHDLQARSRPGGGRVVGLVPRGSKYYRTPTVAWVLEVSSDHRWGRVPIPYSGTRKTGWIPLKGLKQSHTPYVVKADLSAHRITVLKLGRVLFRVPAATGAPVSPTPRGIYFVTDRIPFNPNGSLGAFAFGISGIQTHLPPGWGGGNQLAIHGTNNPASIGKSRSAGCLRVARWVLERLKPLLVLGTPVIIQR